MVVSQHYTKTWGKGNAGNVNVFIFFLPLTNTYYLRYTGLSLYTLYPPYEEVL